MAIHHIFNFLTIGKNTPASQNVQAFNDTIAYYNAPLPNGDGFDASSKHGRSDMVGINFSGISLRRANLTRVNLSYADLSHTNLEEAILDGVTLTGAILRGTNLHNVDLRNLAPDSVTAEQLAEAENINTELLPDWICVEDIFLEKQRLKETIH